MATSIIQLFCEQMRLHPTNPAIVCRDESITFQGLENASICLANTLQSKGIQAGDKVPVISSRCIDAIVGFLAVLRIGACYVPIDGESWSRERVITAIGSLSPRVLIHTGNMVLKFREGLTRELKENLISIATEGALSDGPSSTTNVIRSCVGCIHSQGIISTDQKSCLGSKRSIDDLAYIIFTSSTTGTPKAVMVSNQSLVYYVQQGSNELPFNLGAKPGDQVLLLLSVAFDAFTCITFSTLCNGGTLHLSEPSTFARDAQICTILPITPSLLRLLPDPAVHDSVHSIFLGGESPSADLVRKWSTKRRRLFNGYGTTETTCTSLMSELLPNQPITLGRPIQGSSVFLLSDAMEECPEGEIVITGPGLAVGYYMNDKATTEKFCSWKGLRVYRTGDFARRTKHGVEFMGRRDSLVKNRNFLINLDAQVVTSICCYPRVHDAVAFMHRESLVAFATPASLDTRKLRTHLRETVDSFLVPDRIGAIDNFPLTANGKVDIEALRTMLEGDFPLQDLVEHDHHLSDLRRMLSIALSVPVSDIRTNGSFWSLGGNSFSAIRFLSQIHSHGLTISLKTLYELPSMDLLKDRLEILEPPFKSRESQTGGNSSFDDDGATAKLLCDRPPPTPQQLHMVRSSIENPETCNILVTMDVELDNGHTITPKRLEDAWRQIMDRHSIFRSEFDLQSDSPSLDRDSELEWISSSVEELEFEPTLKKASTGLLNSAQTANKGYAFRPKCAFHLIEVPTKKIVVLWLVHHSIVDGWSISILLDELDSILRYVRLTPPPQFHEFLRERQALVESTRKKSNEFWNNILDGFVPTERLRLARPTSSLDAKTSPLEQKASLGISHLELDDKCRNLKVSAGALIYASWATLLSEYTSSDRVLFGTVFSGRSFPMARADSIVGPLLNTCPFPLRVPFQGGALPFLVTVQERLMSISLNQWAALDDLDGLSSSRAGRLYDTLIAIGYDFPNTQRPTKADRSAFHVSRRDFPEFDLGTYIEDENGSLVIRLVYDTLKFTGPTMKRMVCHFTKIFNSFLQDASLDLGDIRSSMLEFRERETLLQTTQPYTNKKSEATDLKAAFERGVDRWPNSVAIEATDISLSYKELETRSNIAANELTLLAKAGQSVAVLSDGSIDWVIAVIATVKAGAVYVPIDNKLPQQRIEYILTQSKCVVCILPNDNCEASFRGIKFPCLLLKGPLSRSPRVHRPGITNSSNDPAYMIFTSGSTGQPKPVQATHGAIMSYLANPTARLYAGPGRRHAQMFSVGFDVSIAELFGTLCYGATLVLKEEEPFAHLSKVHAAMATPSLLSVLRPEDYGGLDTLMLAGESVPQALADRWSKHMRLYNGYGPCECTIICLISELRSGHTVTLGRPVPRTNVYILNPQKRPVTFGVTGEICVSGIQVADGYFDSTDTGNRRFVENPFLPGERMYCTGDLGAWSEDGEVIFLGRVDNQTKIRGFRVELEEIENAILSVDTTVTGAAALVHDQNIIGLVSPNLIDVEFIRQGISASLPYYALPAKIFAIGQLPTNLNQKLDRTRLEDMVTDLLGNQPPRINELAKTATEHLLSGVWTGVLSLAEEIGPMDDFTALGGHSLRQIHLSRNLSKRFQQTIPLRLIIQHPTLRDMATAIDDHLYANKNDNIKTASFLNTKRDVSARHVLSTLEEEVFQLSAASIVPSAFNVVVKLELVGKLDLLQFQTAVNMVLGQHEILRTVFCSKEGLLRRRILPYSRAPKITFSHADGKVHDYDAEIQRPFRISEELPVSAFLVEATDGYSFILKFHHIVIDKASIKLLLQQISVKYVSSTLGTQECTSSTTESLQYADWAVWNRSKEDSLNDEDASFWRKSLANLPDRLFAPSTGPNIPRPGTHESFRLPQLENIPVSLHLYLGVVSFALRAATGKDDMIIAVSHMDRSELGTSEMIGLFLDRLLIRINPSNQQAGDLSSFLSFIRQNVNEALSHALSFAQVKRLVGADELFDVTVTYHREDESVQHNMNISGIEVIEHPVRMPGARFPLLVEISETPTGTDCHLEFTSNVSEDKIFKFRIAMLEFLNRCMGDSSAVMRGGGG